MLTMPMFNVYLYLDVKMIKHREITIVRATNYGFGSFKEDVLSGFK